jgi:hypothetical protein
VEEQRDAQLDERLAPDLERAGPVLEEHGLPVAEANRDHVASTGFIDSLLRMWA